MNTKRRTYLAYIGAAFFGAALTMSIGAADPSKSVYPRYTPSNVGPYFHIIDNESNRLYIYLNTTKSCNLIGYYDLTQSGKPELTQETVEQDGKLKEIMTQSQ